MRTASLTARLLCAALLGLLLAVRLLGPAGFMPAFDHGTVTIIVCPDASSQPASPMKMGHEGSSKHQEHCPYASAPSFGTFGADFTAFLESMVLVAALLLGRTFAFIERHTGQLRPPLRGPPVPA
jgi:hypothetical protein